MWGSTIPSIYYGFYCNLNLQKLYWSVVSKGSHLSFSLCTVNLQASTSRQLTQWLQVTILAAACVTATLDPQFRHPRFRPYRAAMYTGLGLSAIVFIIHGLVLHGWELQNKRMSLGWMGLMAVLNLIGAAAYASRVRYGTTLEVFF